MLFDMAQIIKDYTFSVPPTSMLSAHRSNSAIYNFNIIIN